MSKFQAYKWTDGDQVPCPEWVSKLIATRGIIKDGDDDYFVGGVRIVVGDYLVLTEHGIHIVPADVYETLRDTSPDVAPAPKGPDEFQHVTDMMNKQAQADAATNAPPHSAAVAARSANARAENAAHEAAQASPKVDPRRPIPKNVGLSAAHLPAGANPYNAASEGANVPDDEGPGPAHT